MTVELFACPGSGNCFKAWLAMQQTGIAFHLTSIDVLAGEQKSPEYLAKNPLGVVPFLTTPSGQGIGESNAMLWYLAEGSHLMPQGRDARAMALQWMFFEQTKLEPFISPARFMTTIAPELEKGREAEISQWQSNAVAGLERLNEHLGGQAFILGQNYSIADIAVFGYTHVIDEAGIAWSEFPNIERWTSNVKETPGFLPMDQMSASLMAVAA